MTSEQTFLENDLWVHSREIFPQKNIPSNWKVRPVCSFSFLNFKPWVPCWVFPGLEKQEKPMKRRLAGKKPGPQAVRGRRSTGLTTCWPQKKMFATSKKCEGGLEPDQ